MFEGSPKRTSLFFPISTGVARLDLPIANRQMWLRDPRRGWCSALIRDKKIGLTVRMDYRYLALFYTWCADVPVPTVEWRTFPQKIKAGEAFKTRLTFLPFSGLDSVEGVGEDFVGSLSLLESPAPDRDTGVRIQLCGRRKEKFEFLLQARRLPDGKWNEVGRKALELQPIDTVSVKIPWRPMLEGGYILRAIPAGQRRKDGSMELLAVVGEPNAVYTMEPESERISATSIPKEKIDLSFCSMQLETPHIKWAKPYARGKLSVAFFLLGRDSAREVVELVQRFDFDVSTSLGSFVGPMYDSGTYYGRLNPELVNKHYNSLLALRRNYDVIVMSGRSWDYLSELSRSSLREMVKEEAGLVWIEPVPSDPEGWELVPVGNPGRTGRGEWKPSEESFLTLGIPWRAFPRARVRRYAEVELEPAEFTAVRGKYPLLLTSFGKGRAVTLTYDASYRYLSGLLPRGRFYPGIRYHYWEYFYSILGRAILYAGRKEPLILFTARSVPGELRAETSGNEKFSVTVHSPRRVEATLAMDFINEYGEAICPTKRIEVGLTKGENKVSLPLPPLPDGLNLAHISLQTDEGTHGWIVVVLLTTASANIEGIKLSRDAYKPSENAEIEVKLSAKSFQGLRLFVRFSDGYGRLLFQDDFPIGQTKSLKLRLALTNTTSMRGVVEASLLRGSKLVDYERKKFIIIPSKNGTNSRALSGRKASTPAHTSTSSTGRKGKSGEWG